MEQLITIIENEPLAPHTSWRIGGPARFYCTPRTPPELQQALQWAAERSVPVFVLGGGSNLLVRDAGYNGLVVRYRNTHWRIAEQGSEALLHVGAGAPMAGTARRVSNLGWAGVAWAEGLPGTIGGAVFGNAGCYGGDIASVLERATLLVGNEVQEWPVQQLGYGYRTSVLKRERRPQTADDRPQTIDRSSAIQEDGQPSTVHRPSSIVLDATLRLTRGDPATLQETMARIASERRSKTPWGRSCGSVFKNPPGTSAGKLIEQTGLKGTRSGDAQISERHGNYIVNLQNATSDDLLRLIELAQQAVMRQFGIELELEVQLL